MHPGDPFEPHIPPLTHAFGPFQVRRQRDWHAGRRQAPYDGRTSHTQRANWVCGHCAALVIAGWACELGAALRAARRSRSRPHPHPKGTPRLRSGTAPPLNSCG